MAISLADQKIESSLESIEIRKAFEEFILEKDHPCIMAQSVFLGNNLSLHVYPELGTKESAQQMLRDISTYLEEYDENSSLVYSFLAVFGGRKNYTEEEFEELLWKQLQLIHEEDKASWDPKVKEDPADPEFSFSIAGKAFYTVGLHPQSSRKARQAPYPTLALNLHSQFEKLREQGRFELVQEKIRDREIALQGDLNPMLANFGQSSEARQYSGRKVGEEWKCPFLHKKDTDVPAKEISKER